MSQSVRSTQALLLRELLVIEQEFAVDMVTRLHAVVNVAAILCILQHPLLKSSLTHLCALLWRSLVESLAEQLIVCAILRPNLLYRHTIPNSVVGGLLTIIIYTNLVVARILLAIYLAREAILKLGIEDVARAVHITNHMDYAFEIDHYS